MGSGGVHNVCLGNGHCSVLGVVGDVLIFNTPYGICLLTQQ